VRMDGGAVECWQMVAGQLRVPVHRSEVNGY
jgi:hypothetical protein